MRAAYEPCRSVPEALRGTALSSGAARLGCPSSMRTMRTKR